MYFYSPYWAYWSNQHITGTVGRDWLFGGYGNDRIWSGAGADFVWGGFGHDQIWSGEGNDTLLGGWGADTLYGEGGNDRLYGGAGHDVLFAGDGRDSVAGGRGHDQIFLGDDDDVAWGGAGRDVIYVGTGNDRVYGGRDFDTVVAEGSIRNYNLIHNGDGAVTLQHLAYNSDVIDQNLLRGVELIKFKDGSYYLDGRNNDPRAKNDHAETGQSGALILQEAQVLENDVDWDGDALSVVSVSATSDKGGTVTLTDGQITYVPAPGFAALGVGQSTTDRFYYTIDDGRGGQATASFWLTITGANDAPTLTPGVLAAAEDGAAVDLDLSTLGADADSEDDGSTLSYELLFPPAEGMATVTGHTLSFAPGDDFQDLAEGEARDVTLQIRATDAQGAQVVNSVTVTVTGRNDVPVITGPARLSVDENTSGQVASYAATDAEGQAMTYSLLGDDAGRFTISVDGALNLTQSADYEAPSDANGDNVYALTVQATDAQGARAVQALAVTVKDVPEYNLVVSEIMYNPASQEPGWEWVEITNTGDAPADLSGWVFDDNNGTAQSGANIASGSIPAGGSAILYNADAISAEDFAAAWGTGINLIGVTGWDRASLNNSGDTIGLWASFDSYQNDHATHADAVLSLTYDDANGWPVDDGAGSIYLKDLSADASDGANWALSRAEEETPVNTGETALADGGNSGADVGSPGGLTPVGDVKISEFRPNPSGADPATTQVELSGNAGAVFSGYLVAIESDSSGAGTVNQAFAVSGTFDANGLLAVTVPDFENPSMTLVLTDRFDLATADAVDVDTDDDGTVDDQSVFGKIYDAIGVPDSAGDQTTLYGAALGGTDFVYTGDEPQLIFRDSTTGDLYAVNDPVRDKVFGADGTQWDLGDFDRDPTQASFGTENPSYVPPPLTLIINEVLADPASGDAGDANGDGTRDAAQDEFVEILNTGDASVDLSGVTLSDGAAVRHVFAQGTTLEAGQAIVVFGGGTPMGDFGGAQVVTASSGALGLNNSGDSVILTQPGGTEVDRLTYGAEGGRDVSLTRAPDGSGSFVAHTSVSDATYSPGTQINGLGFGETVQPSGPISINEIRHSQRSVDKDEFIELYSADPAASLDGMTLIALNGEGDAGRVSMALDVSAGSFDADGVFMIADSRITTGSFDAGDISVSGGLNLSSTPTTYMLVKDFTGAVGDDLDTDDDGTLDAQPWGAQLDAVGFENGDDTADILYTATTVAPDGGFTASGGVAKGDGADTFEALDFRDLSNDSPGSLNGGGTPPPSDARLISQVQGSGAASAMVGQTVTVTAIVVGDFQNNDGDTDRNLGGFFLQEEAADHDGDANTSEGIFVYEGTGNLLTDVSLGDRVTVTGTVGESFGQTQITATNVVVDQAGAVADVTTLAQQVSLDDAGAISDGSGGYTADLEAYEGMLVQFSDTLTVSEAFQMDRFGEVRLSASGRPVQYTQENAPDAAGYAQHLRDVASDSIIFDDGKTTQNPTPFTEADLNGDGVVNTADGFGMGDTITNATGVLNFGFNEFRLHSVQSGDNRFVDTQTRDTSPPDLARDSDGAAPDLVISSFNVLNFFTTLDNGSAGAGPAGLDPRGAETAQEYQRQLEKLVTTLDLMNADIIGLVELENEFQSDQNGDGLVAIEEIVKAMNAIDGAGIWAYVDPGRSYVDTGDAISVGMIYRTDKVTLSGPAQILDDATVAALSGDYGADPLFDGSSTNRAPLAANFTYDYRDLGGNPASETFTVAVTHMKSKGGTGTGGNADQGDGAGNYNETRTEGVRALVEWLDADRTGGFADADQIVLGDFNAYAKEAPITAMQGAGYQNLEEIYEPGSTTFVFDGQTGTLDYAFASGALAGHVTNAGAWNINSAEPDLYDYNLNLDRDLTTNERDPAIFDGDVPFRTSDHDPLLIGLNFSDDPLTS